MMLGICTHICNVFETGMTGAYVASCFCKQRNCKHLYSVFEALRVGSAVGGAYGPGI